jgi:hypothetical protein
MRRKYSIFIHFRNVSCYYLGFQYVSLTAKATFICFCPSLGKWIKFIAMFKKSCYFALLGLTIISCKDIVYKTSGVGDANIITVVTATDTLFGLGLHAYSSWEFDEVTASLNGDSIVYQLNPFNEAKTDMSYETPLNKMTHKLPPVGTYTFDATFANGDFLNFTDVLTSEYILPPLITTCEYSSTIHAVIVSWGEILNTDILNIKLYNQNRELLYISPTINKSVVIFTFNTANEGWLTKNYPVAGQQLIVQVSTFLLEPINGGSSNIQATGRIEKTITWGN